MSRRWRPFIAFIVFVGWLIVTAFSSRLFEPMRQQPLDTALSEKFALDLALAILFLIAAILVFRWRDLGLNKPLIAGWLKLLWLPLVYVVLALTMAVLTGLPAIGVILIVIVNTAMVGVSEELACRGVLYRGFRSRLAVWPAILLSTMLFGAAHIVNGFSTGDFATAIVQAGAAFMSGIAFMAIRLRTGSLYPGMALHALFDCSITLMALSSATSASDATPTGSPSLIPLLVVLPNFFYGLYLLRHAERDEVDPPDLVTQGANVAARARPR